MAENMAILPAMESLGFSFALPLRGSGIVYITFIISFLSAFILFQSAEAVSGTGPSEAGIFIKDTLEKVKLSKPAFYRFLSFIINPVSFLGVILRMIFSRAGAAGKTAKSKSVLKTAVWKWPSDIISEIADCCTPLTESSINLSLAAAIALAAAFIIIAAAGGFN